MVRKREIIIGVTILVIATAAYLFGWTNLFTVKNISISGAPNVQTTNAIMRISELKVGEKMARVEPRNIESKLASSGIGWLESVDISRNWFNGKVTLKLRAREAMAISGSQFVDVDGTLFTSPIDISESAKAKLPELIALNQTNQASSSAAKFRANGLSLYLELPKDFQAKIKQITVSSRDNFQFIVELGQKGRELKINWGSRRDTAVKTKIFNALIALPENKNINSMDLSEPTKPSVK